MGWWTNIGGDRRQNGSSHLSEMGLLPYGMFQRELQRQRAMSDRSGGNFVLVVFSDPAGAGTEGKSGPAKLAAVIASRIRLSDVAGEYDNHSRIGVILPDTDAKGAELFIEAVETLLRREMNGRWRPDSKWHCEVSSYPQAQPVVALAAERQGQKTATTGKY